MNKSPDLLAGFDLFQFISITQPETRFPEATWWCYFSPFLSNRDFGLAGFMDGIFQNIVIDQRSILIPN